MMKWESIDISEEEIRRQLEERPGGRIAGRGDSPYTQEFYEKTYGIGRDNGRRFRTPNGKVLSESDLVEQVYAILRKYGMDDRSDAGKIVEY